MAVSTRSITPLVPASPTEQAMRSRSIPLLHPLVWLAAWFVLACHPKGPVTPIAPHSSAPAAAAALPSPPPISLTASDGTGLALASLRARTVIDEPLALTELQLAFENPGDQTMEGRFELLLPPGARVTRFALLASDGWHEAEVVEKQQARQTYETFLHEDRDPALLERDTGNRFSARVFPIEPYDRKHILISYVESLADPNQPWRLGLRGLPWLEDLEVEVLFADPIHGMRTAAQRHASNLTPTEDLVVLRDAPRDDGVRHGEQVIARVQPLAGLELDAGPPIQRLTVLVDTSASRALDFESGLERLGHVLHALARHAGTAELQVLAFDQEVVPIYAGPLLGFGAAQLAVVRARRPLGASNLGLALRALETGKHQRVLLVSDGLISAGERSDAVLRRQLHALGRTGVERLDVLVLGSVRDEPRLQRLVAGPLPSSGVLVRPTLAPQRAAARLMQPTLDGLRVEVPGARWWSPTRLDGLQPDDHVLVYADLSEDQPLHVQVSGPVHRDMEIPLHATQSALHDQGWRQAQIEGLVERLASLQDELESTRLRRHVVELSVRHRIFNDFTAFLVLETDEDYARFGLDRRALDDILVVGPDGAEMLQRGMLDGETSLPSQPRIGRGSIKGVVVDDERREPIANALIVLQCSCLAGSQERMTTDRGTYAFEDLPSGVYTVQVLAGTSDVSKIVDLSSGAATAANFRVDPRAEFRRVIRVESRRSVRRRNRERRRDTDDAGFELPSEPTVRQPASTPPPVFELRPIPEPELEPEPEPDEPELQVDTSVGRTITTEELRNIPIGSSTSRDFTAVVDVAATSSRDSAGISLAGSTGAESMYIVEGANMSTPSKPQPTRVHLLGTRVERSHLGRRAVRSSIRENLGPVRHCYYRALAEEPSLQGRLVIQLRTDADGRVRAVGKLVQRGLEHDELLRCIERSMHAWVLPSGASTITQTLSFRHNDGPPSSYWSSDVDDPFEPNEDVLPTDPFTTIEALITNGEITRAQLEATAWRERAPIDVLALVALGDAAKAGGDPTRAARAYGSILDLYPSRAEMLRFAAALLEALGDPAALDVAIDAYRQAVEQRPDHPTGRRNLAFALLRRGEPEAAFDVLVQALARRYPPDRFAGVQQRLRQDLGIVAAAWRRQRPTRASSIQERLATLGIPLATEPSMQLVLTWETDVNDVDLHVQDAEGNQAHGDAPQLPSGGELLADVSNGFGPEAFTVSGPATSYPYRLTVHYYARGPMGYGLGKVQVLHHDGAGGVHLDDRPFVAMDDDAWVGLGEVQPPPSAVAAD